MRIIDLSSWQTALMTIAVLAFITLVGVGVRLIAMMTIQQRRERANRQINERLKTLIAAYKVLGGSFTGDLTVNPSHLRDIKRRGVEQAVERPETAAEPSDRPRRIRDAVEAALSDVILLGTEGQVRLAERAARELVAGRAVHIDELVVALRDFIRQALDLDPVPADLAVPKQGPTRPSSGGRGGRSESGRGSGGGGMGGGGTGGGGIGIAGETPPASSP